MADPVPETYAQARNAGLRFYTGADCQAHPQALRYVANRRCVACVKAERLARAKADPAAERERKRQARIRRLTCPPEPSLAEILLTMALSPIEDSKAQTKLEFRSTAC